MPKKLTSKFDVLIVGGGIIGMLTARNLQNVGLSVAIIDKGNLGGGSTWAAGGILSSLTPWQENNHVEVLIDEGRQNFAELANELKQETGIDPEYTKSGMLVLNVNEIQQALEWARRKKETLEVISQQTLLTKEPHLAKNFAQSLYLPNIAQVRPPSLISALQKSLQQRNIKIYENTSVNEILINADKATGAITQDETIYAEKIVICSGAWSKKLLPEIIDIEPVRGQMLLYKLAKKILSHIVLKEQAYLIPRQDGHILCGSTIEHVGFKNETTIDAKQTLQNLAHELLPILSKYQPCKQWSALRPGTQRNTPYICKHPRIKGLYINTGHYRYGIVMSIGSAKIMTGLITNTLNSSQIGAFS